MLSVYLFGEFRIEYNNTHVLSVDTPRLQSLLAYLILRRGIPQLRSHLAFLFWPDTNESQARTNLRNLLHNLRRALPNPDACLDVGVNSLHWRDDSDFFTDVAEFETEIAAAETVEQRADSAAARKALKRSVAIYQGELLPSCYDDWIIPFRERYRQMYIDALEQLAQMYEETREYYEALHAAQQLLVYDPLHEAAYRRLIRLHALNEDRASALRVYHNCATILMRELAVEPSASTREIYEQLINTESGHSPAIPMTTPFSPLIGREKEWIMMLETWRLATSNGGGQVLILSGEAGIGKTRLAEEFLQWTARQGIPSRSTRCYAAEGELACAPVASLLRLHPLAPLEDVWLAEVARLLPEILVRRPDLPKPVALTEAWQRQRLFEALSHTVLGNGKPLLLMIDDLQWCDQDTLDWLHFLLRFDPHAQLLVLGAYRPEEVDTAHPLLAWLHALRMQGQLTEIDLNPLDETATQVLAVRISGEEMSLRTAQQLFRETEGNPLFIVEILRLGMLPHLLALNCDKYNELAPNVLSQETALPPKVRSVLERRLAQVSPACRELARLAAVIGREFSFILLAHASDCDEKTVVRQLDELWQRRIVREHGVDSYDFTHDKLREVAYHDMTTARRHILHRSVAQALEDLSSGQSDAVSHQIAAHYESAGMAEKAVPYYLRAAGVARQIFANQEAISLLQHGLALVEKIQPTSDQSVQHKITAQFLEALGDVLEIQASHEQALEAYQNTQKHILPDDQIQMARLHRKIGIVFREQRQYQRALDACARAEDALGSQPREDISSWWNEWIEVRVDQVWANYWLAHWVEMEALVEELKPVVLERAKPENQMRFLLASCLMQLRRERYVVSQDMLNDSREILSISQECGDMKTRIESQFELGFLHLWRHELDDAEQNLLAALYLTEKYGGLTFRTLALTYLTIQHRFRGHMEDVAEFAQRAQQAAETAHMPDYVAAARGNQAWVAWRRQDLTAAEKYGLEALAIWHKSPLVYPFQWMALWPLITVSLIKGREQDAWTYIYLLLESTQQCFPDELNSALETAVMARADTEAGSVLDYLDRALEIAMEMGYL